MLKKRGIFFVFAILLSTGIFAQGFGFDFQYGGGRSGYVSSGVAGAITSALDIIFGGIVEPLFDAIEFNFYGATKLALWIILYLIFSNTFKNYFSKQKMHNKFSKVIAAILALFSVVFIPETLLDTIFRDLLGGFVGLLLLAAVVGFPLYYLFKWSRDNKEIRSVNLISAFLFFLLMIIFSQLNNQFVYAFDIGFVQGLTSLIVVFAIIFALIMCIHRAYLGFKRTDEEIARAESQERDRGESNGEERDEFGNEKALAQRLIGIANGLRQEIHNVSDIPETLAKELLRNQDRLNFVNISSIHNLHEGVTHLCNKLKNAKKNKQKARDASAQIINRYNGLHDSLDSFSQLRRKLSHHLEQLKIAMRTGAAYNPGYFGDLIGRLRVIDRNLKELVTVLSRVGIL